MFLNIFKKVEKQVTSNKLISEDELVKQIHDEVDSLEEKSIKAVENLLSSLNIPTIGKVNEKADLMKSLGFGNNNETITQSESIKQDIKDKQKIKEDSDNKLKLINEYRLYYPNDKIITFKEFEKVLYKYNLIYAPVKAYIKDVPEKNLLEIKKAKNTSYDHRPVKLHVVTNIKISDNSYSYQTELSYIKSVIHKIPTIASLGKKVRKYKVCTLPVDEQLKIAKNATNTSVSIYDRPTWRDWRETTYSEYRDNLERNLLVDSYETIECSKDDLYQVILDECRKIKKPLKEIQLYALKSLIGLETTQVDRGDLFIAAPKTHFDLENLSSWNGKEFFMKQPVKITYIKDPIAFNILKGVDGDPYGFVRIISKWGTSDDKSYLDPIVQDERMN